MKKWLMYVLFLSLFACMATFASAEEGPWRQNSYTQVGVDTTYTTNLGLKETLSPGVYLEKQKGITEKVAFLLDISAREAPKLETDGEGERYAAAVEVRFFPGRHFSLSGGGQFSRTETPLWDKESFVPFLKVGYSWNFLLYELRITDRDNTENEAQSYGISVSGAIPTRKSYSFICTARYAYVEYGLLSASERLHGQSVQIELGVRF